ncbi:MAG: hypothetical protein LBV78_13565 [Kitasatospora sp.]|jgi:hypothetical protein|nr:hypothetical protein [Kitasatospora sp.]
MARARYCLALMVVGWAASWVALRSEEDAQGLLKHCLDSPGLPGYALLLAWAGPMLSLAAAGWAVRLALRTLRETSRPISAGRGLLFVALPAALWIGVFQGVVLEDGHTYRGAQRSPCVGAATVLR